MNWSVYAITNEEGVAYIGASARVSKRLSQHMWGLTHSKHHNKLLQDSWNKSEGKGFSFTILASGLTKDDAAKLEKEEITSRRTLSKVFNINTGFYGGDTLTFAPDRDERISRITYSVNKNVEEMSEQERKDKWSRPGEANPMFGKTHTAEARSRISKAHKGNAYCKGRSHSKETKEKLSKIRSEKVGKLNPFFGKLHTKETKEKIRQKLLGKVSCPAQCRKIKVNGVIYASVSEGARAIGISPSLMIHRLRSKTSKFDQFNYCD
jgi:group I intron endonuclease